MQVYILVESKTYFHFNFATFVGVSKIKQAWSTGSEYQLLVRDHTCCCKACLQQDFTQCDVKVG